MGSPSPKRDPRDPSLDELREMVPARAVLTELARGFLLAQGTNPDRAVRFAATFLREYTGRPAPTRVEGTRPVPLGRRRLGTGESGEIDPTNFPPVR